MTGPPISIRAARAAEAEALSALALRSKAHWGYDAAFLEACRVELTVRPESIEQDVVVVLESAGRARGFYTLRPGSVVPEGSDGRTECDPGDGLRERAERDLPVGPDKGAELELFYVDPDSIGAGFGRLLWRHMVVSARARGYKRVYIHSDPHAEGFYLAMGARRVGVVASGSIDGRPLPLMCLDIE